MESFIGEFVINVYSKNYSECLKRLDFEDTDKFKSIIDKVHKGLNEDCRETKIVEYKTEGNEYSIYGIMKSEGNKMDLFKMTLIIEDEIKIISFSF